MYLYSSGSVLRRVSRAVALSAIVSFGLLSIVATGGDDDPGPGTLQFSAASYSGNEDAGSITVSVTRTGGSKGAVSIDVSDTGTGTASSGTDYTAITTSTLDWADADATTKTVEIMVIADAVVEPDESINLSLSNVTGGAAVGTASTDVTILNDDAIASPGTLQFGAPSYSGAENAGAITVTVTRTGGSNGAVSVELSDATTGSATSGTDYSAITTTTLSWLDAEATPKTFDVVVSADATVEPDETVNLSLANATGGAVLGSATTVVTIVNDDANATLQFSPASYTVAETGSGVATITVTRTGSDVGAVAVDYASSDGTATAGVDYTAVSGTLNWDDGISGAKTFTVTVINDGMVEVDETVILDLSNPTGGASIIVSTATLTINDGTDVACLSTANDSVETPTGWIRIHSESFGIYGLETLSRETLGASGPTITMDYMVHEPPAVPSALVVLLAGGQLNANITIGSGIGSAPSSAAGNFLVRSAHLFAAQGYRVLTVDRPTDFFDYTGGLSNGYAYDNYRTSMEHAVDLSQLINVVNAADNLPVILAGTSRGSISAVAQHALGSALALSAPLTSGANGTPIGTGNVLPANVPEPVQVSWHVNDACNVTTPANALSLVGDFSDATGVAISGGFASQSSARTCDADHFHGFPGIESCAVKQETDWMALKLAALPTTRPVATAQSDLTTQDTQKLIDLTGFATAAAGGALSYSLPHALTSLGGSISISANSVTYIPPNGVSAIVDTFVYVVNEVGGGTSHNVVSITINP